MSSPTPDLTLPPFTPALTSVLAEADCTGASFALYTLVAGVSASRLGEIARVPQEEWEGYDMDTRLVKPGEPRADFAGGTLADVVAAHVAMDKGLSPREGGGGAATAAWWPHVFVVVVGEDLEDHGLLLVYGFEPPAETCDEGGGDDGEACEGLRRDPVMGKFFIRPKHLCDILSNVALSGDDLDYLHARYDMDGDRGSESDSEEEEKGEDRE